MRAENATSVVDGNAAAGILSEVFAGDVTSAIGVCGGCGARAMLAEAIVELDEAAAIVRCRDCTHTLVTVLRDAAQTRIVIGTLKELEITRDEARAGA
jgi:DNA-directed RNA polymerase subunit RPC12/RpoP